MSTIVTRQASRLSRDPVIPPTSLRAISKQRCLSEARDEDVINDNDNGNTLEDSQPSRKGKGRAEPPSGEPSNLPQDTNDPRNFGGDPGDDDPASSGDGDDPYYTPSSPTIPCTPDALAQLLTSLTRPATAESKARVREPEVYDGTDQAKLCTFFLQCYINFRDRPSAFHTGSAKIQYAISYLSGSALQYFEPAIPGEVSPEPVWLRDWDAFKGELQMNFGPYDNAAQAEIELEKIVIKEHHKAARLFIAFSWASTRTQWNDAALRHFAYKGLAKRIKDELLHFPRYRSLAELRNFALEIDSHYWERKEYDTIGSNSRSAGYSNNSSGNHSTQDQGSSNQGSNNSKSGKKNKSRNSNSNNSGTNNATTPAKTTTDTSLKLGKDGKLLPEERQRRIDQGLCLLCGQKGHLVKECPKATSTSSNSKGRAAKTTDSKTEASASTSDSKK